MFNHPQRFFHQSINTYSNLAYFFFGILILLIARHDHRHRTNRPTNRLAGFPLMGVCFVYLSIGSAFFHASLTYAGERINMNATYSILLTLVDITLYYIGHRIRLSGSPRAMGNFAVSGDWLVLPIALRVPSSRLVPALILLLNAGMVIHYVQFRRQRSISIVLLSLVLVVLAICIRTLDVQKVGCDPYFFFQGHALWHLLTALSSFCSYCFFRFPKAE
ncbi:hypothetical protein GCM10023187_16110 [Nibrella viscosa]|uniref:Ceramidase n=1 Tax=Nibrella viscosa TaxID=1084524 RepID=A0ABP8K7R5_9BACT